MNSLQLKAIGENGIPFSGIFLLKGVTKKVAKNGKSYLLVEVGDRFGSFSFNIYEDSPIFGLMLNGPREAFLRIDGLSEIYNDRFSPRIQSIRRIPAEEIRRENLEKDLIAGPNESPEALRQELESYRQMIGHEGLRQTVQNALLEVDDKFWTHTAAVSMHHAYRCGLLEHSVHVARAGIKLLPAYPFINGDLAIAGMLLHDVGKTLEYDGETAFERTRAGLLQGHVVLGYRIVRKAAMKAGLDDDLLVQLEHIILSHQGLLEYGAAALPATPEGVFVALVDNLDAKLNMVERTLETAPDGQEFSDRIPGLENVRLYTGGRQD